MAQTGHVTSPDRAVMRWKRLSLAGLLASAALVFVALAIWQLHRRIWKLEWIHAVDSRVSAPVQPAPGPTLWSDITAQQDAYRHISVTGVFLNNRETLVQAVSAIGAGYWLLTPLRTNAGWTVLVNRGFVPDEQANPASRRAGQSAEPETVNGLLRITEPKGSFLLSNDPAAGRWYSRDVSAIAAARHLAETAPYFIDADAAPNPGGFPVGGLTVIYLPNNHLIYALTWLCLAVLSAVAAIRVMRVDAS